jgi:hypothetical protein
MFIIERRTAGVLAALAIPAALALLSNVWDRDGGIADPSVAMSTAALARSVGPEAGPIAVAADAMVVRAGENGQFRPELPPVH